jgi:glycosyltransferase involved in cell wall biosynthesis
MQPLVSVVMPAYNGQRFIAAALESVREQANESIELVIVNDGSTDRTPEIVREFAKVLPIRVMNPGRMGNWVAATNLGLREAGGEWACFLHQDDLWLPGRMARLRGAIEIAEGALIVHNAMFVDQNGRSLGPWTCPLPEGVLHSELFLERLLIQNFIAIPSPIFRRKVVIESGGLDESLWFSADWDLWLRLGALGTVSFIPETLSAFRVHPSSQTAARKLMPHEWNKQLTTVLARHLPNWKRFGKNVRSVERAAETSITVNAALVAVSRGERLNPWPSLLDFVTLGPSGCHRYLRDSRIVQRLGSRLRAQWRAKFENRRD